MDLIEMRAKLLDYDEFEKKQIEKYNAAGGYALIDDTFPSKINRNYPLYDRTYYSDRTIGFKKHSRFCIHKYHSHSIIEIIFMYKGSCKNIVENEETVLKEGDICIISPGVLHLPIVGNDDILLNFLVNQQYMEKLLSDIKAENTLTAFLGSIFKKEHYKYIHIKSSTDKTVHELASLLALSFMNEAHCDSLSERKCLFGSLLYKLLHSECDMIISKDTFTADNDISSLINDAINLNYRTLTLDELADQFSYSKSHISHVIKSTRGETFSEIVNRMKINDACKLLVESNAGISKIAYDCGFSNVEYFNRCFKKQTGMSPSAYRRSALTV